MWMIGKSERLHCPKQFQDRLTKEGGLNRYGQPNFKVVWGQTETMRIAGRDGYRETLTGFGEACWILMRWVPAETYGPPDIFYFENYDKSSGLQFMGEYPWKGRYQTLFPMRTMEEVNGKNRKDRLSAGQHSHRFHSANHHGVSQGN